MATRSRKEDKRYKKYRASNSFKETCTFCNMPQNEIVDETKSFKVVKNLFSYSQWDGQGVSDHLMIIPKRHTDKLSDLSSSEAVEFMNILGSYELRGYDTFARAPLSNRKTIRHQHTHLIKLDRKTKKFLLYLNKPYVRLLR